MGTKDGSVLESVLGSDVYGQDLAALRARYPDRVYVYAYDWRKSVANALGGVHRRRRHERAPRPALRGQG